MNEVKLQVGDVVQLRSGGPKMTVYQIDGNGNYHVNWFDTQGHIQDSMFESGERPVFVLVPTSHPYRDER